MSDDLSHEERQAAALMQHAIGGVVRPRDVDGMQGVHDFDLVDELGAVLMHVEVSRITDPGQEASRRGIRKHLRSCTELQHAWNADQVVAARRSAKEDAAGLCDLLAQLESQSIAQLILPSASDPDLDDDGEELIAKMRSLNLLSVELVAGGAPGQIFVNSIRPRPRTPRSLEAAVLELTRAKEDQIGRIDATDDAQRVLFLWVEPASGRPHAQILRWDEDDDSLRNKRRIALPHAIDAVFVAGRQDPLGRLYRCDADGWAAVELEISAGDLLPTYETPITGEPE